MSEHDEITQRLASFGQAPIDPATASQHLGQMALAVPTARGPRFARLRVAAALGAGVLIGGTSLAGAGVLDNVAQPVLETVGVDTRDDDKKNEAEKKAQADDESTTTSSTVADETTTTTVAQETTTTTVADTDEDGSEGCSGFGEAHESGQPKPRKSDYCDNGNPDPHKVGPDADDDADADDADADEDDDEDRGGGGGNGHRGDKHGGKHADKDG